MDPGNVHHHTARGTGGAAFLRREVWPVRVMGDDICHPLRHAREVAVRDVGFGVEFWKIGLPHHAAPPTMASSSAVSTASNALIWVCRARS